MRNDMNDIDTHVAYLERVKKVREVINKQIADGVVVLSDRTSLDEFDEAISRYSDAIDQDDMIFVLLERRVLDDSIVKLTKHIFMLYLS